MPDAKELLHSNLHEVFPNGTLNADGPLSSGPIRKTCGSSIQQENL
jgi:hypothetical protein